MKQQTLFDLSPYDSSTPPVIRLRDDVWSIELRLHLQDSDGTFRCAVQVSHAITEELSAWWLSPSATTPPDQDRLVEEAIARFRSAVAEYRCPF